MKKLCLALILFLFCTLSANAQSGLFVAPSSASITSPVTGQTWLFNSTNKTISVWTGSSYLVKNYPFSNLTASTNPTVSNDNTQGYVVGSFWVNQTTQTLYMATSVGTGAAVWLGVNQVTSSIPLANIQQGGATNGQSLMWNNGGGVWAPGNPAINLNQLLQSGATTNQVVTWNGSAWVAANTGTGTVTSISTGNLSPLFTASIASPTTTPVLSFALSNAASHSILSNTSGSSGAPSYNVLNITAGTGLSGGGAVATSPTINLQVPVTVPNGGTGQTSLTSNAVLLGNGTGPCAFAAPGTAGYPLLSTGLSGNPAFGQLALGGGAVSGLLPIANGGTNSATAAAAISALIGGSPSSGQVLYYNGSAWVPFTVSGSGTVTTFSSGNASPLFSTSVANPGTTPAQSFTVSNAGAGTILSNPSGSPAAPSYNAHTISTGTGLTGGGNITANPTISLNVPISNSNLNSTVVTSAGNLSPLFTTSISAQTLGFVLSSVGAHQYLGNSTGSSAAPAFQVIAASDLPSTTVNTVGNLSPIFTSSISGQALSFSLTNAAGHGILSNTSGSAGTPAYNVLSLVAGTGLAITNSGVLATSPTVSLQTPVSVAHGGTGTALFTNGTVQLSSGSFAVSDASITSSSVIVVSQQGNGAALVESFDVELNAGVGFTIYSSNVASTAFVSYIRLN